MLTEFVRTSAAVSSVNSRWKGASRSLASAAALSEAPLHPVCDGIDPLIVELQTELDLTRRPCRRHITKSGRAENGRVIRILRSRCSKKEIRVIGNVERFGAEFEAPLLA